MEEVDKDGNAVPHAAPFTQYRTKFNSKEGAAFRGKMDGGTASNPWGLDAGCITPTFFEWFYVTSKNYGSALIPGEARTEYVDDRTNGGCKWHEKVYLSSTSRFGKGVDPRCPDTECFIPEAKWFSFPRAIHSILVNGTAKPNFMLPMSSSVQRLESQSRVTGSGNVADVDILLTKSFLTKHALWLFLVRGEFMSLDTVLDAVSLFTVFLIIS